MAATRKVDAPELLLFLQLLSFNIKNTAKYRKKEHCPGCRRHNVKKHYFENDLAKTDLYTLNRRQNISC